MITEQMICDAGLFPYTPETLAEFPTSLYQYCGKGIGIWQYPNQFAPYINKLLENKIESYLEIGTAAGGTFTFTSKELIKNGCKSCFALDVAPIGESATVSSSGSPFKGLLADYIAKTPECAFYNGTSASFFTEHRPYPVDLVLIDGDHSYSGVARDWLMAVGRAKIIAFHDIVNQEVPGVGRLWNEVKNNRFYHCFEYIEQYGLSRNYLGIGLLIQKQIMSGGVF